MKENDYIFRNFFGDITFNEGIHYWEIIADARTEHELKVGVSSTKELQRMKDFNKAKSENEEVKSAPVTVHASKQFNKDQEQVSFSDCETGWAFFGIGRVRHNSNMHGKIYGKPFKRQGVLGCFLNMNKGQLAFAIDGQYQGVAFQSDALKKGPLYPAISLLHDAGCILVTGKYPPSYFWGFL